MTTPSAAHTSHRDDGLNLGNLASVRTPTPRWVERLHAMTIESGQWKVADIDLSKDVELWQKLAPNQQAAINRALSRFVHGEGQVENNLDPLIARRNREGRTEEARYIEIFQQEEAKHKEFFLRYFKEVVGQPVGIDDPYSAAFRRLFNNTLEFELAQLKRSNWRQEVRALTTYMLVCEGTIAETAYHGFAKALDVNGEKRLPGLLEGLYYIKRDEARHVGYGVHALRRCVEENGLPAAVEVVAQLSRVVRDAFGCVGMVHKEFKPFPFPELDQNELRTFARHQFFSRVRTLIGNVWDLLRR